MAPFSGVISQLRGGRLINIEPHPSWKGQHFVLTEIDTVDMDLPSPTDSTSAKTTIHGLRECLIHQHGILQNIASDQGTHFTANELWQWACAHGIHWSYHVPHHLEAVDLIQL